MYWNYKKRGLILDDLLVYIDERTTEVADSNYDYPHQLWDGAKATHGYGQLGLWIEGKQVHYRVHRLITILENGDDIGEHTDHLCRIAECVESTHLEAVTARENIRRGVLRAGVSTHCKRGHLQFTQEQVELISALQERLYSEGADGGLAKTTCLTCQRGGEGVDKSP